MSSRRRIQSVFGAPEPFVEALKGLREAGIGDFEAFAPTGIEAVEQYMPRRGSPMRFITLAAGICGAAAGLALCIGSAVLYGDIVGGKPPVSLIPYCVVGFELTILVAGVMTLAAVLGLSRLRPQPLRNDYVPGFSSDKFGITIVATPEQAQSVAGLLRSAGAEEVIEAEEGA